MERMETQPSFAMFKPPNLHVPIDRPKFVEGQAF
jgi:hypothetical protein